MSVHVSLYRSAPSPPAVIKTTKPIITQHQQSSLVQILAMWLSDCRTGVRGVLFGNSVKWWHMSVKSRSDMTIKTNIIWFPHRGVRLTPNPSKHDLSSTREKQRLPRKAKGLGTYKSKSSNQIYKRKSGNVYFPRKDICDRGGSLHLSLPLSCTTTTPS